MDSIPFEKVKSTFKSRYLNIANELGDDSKVLDYQEHIAKLLEQLGMKKDWWRPWEK
tara:strand:- start:192 stop:362 length:171 start_codon:yes stop_codon:yes gene_type:complete